MLPATIKQIVLASRPLGRAELENFRLEEVPMPVVPPDGVLLRVLYLSLDPYMRGRMDASKSYAPSVEVGDVMVGAGVGEVVESRHPEFQVGDTVLARTGWQDYAACQGAALRKVDASLAPASTSLGILGMPGFTAWAGLHLIGKPKAGETVVVAAASGPVGSLVGQLARQAGARAVGIAGGPQKCEYVKKDLKFDAVVDHRSPDFRDALRAACPRGIDVYFENVGGAVWDAVLPLLNQFARVPVCGLIAQYNGSSSGDQQDRLAQAMREILSKSLIVQGFINFDFADEHYSEFLRVVSAGIAEGHLRYREDVTEGLENAPAAFLGMLEGKNFGKTLIRVSH